MKKSFVLIVVTFCLATYPVMAQTPVFQEDFEKGIPTSFILFDQDGLHPELEYPENMAWTGWTDPDDSENTVAASTSFYSPVGSSNDWMILPAIELPDDPESCQLYWRSRSAYDTYKDGYVVLLSEQTQISPEQLIEDSNSWKTILQVPNSQNPASWNTFLANLSEYAGKKVYIAFVNNTYDGWMLFLDDITIGARESVRKASVRLTSDRYATDGKLPITATVKAGILDPLSYFTARLTSEGDTIVEDIMLNTILLPNDKSEIVLKNQLSGEFATARDYKLELLFGNKFMSADSSRVVYVAPLQGKPRIVAEGLVNKSQNGGYGPRLIEGYKLLEEKYGDGFIGIEVHGPNSAEDDLVVSGQENYLEELQNKLGALYGKNVMIDRKKIGDAYDDIDSLSQNRLKKRLLCTATANGQSDDNQIDAEARVVFGIPLTEASFTYEWVIVEDSLWTTQWNLYSGGLFGPFLGYESLPIETTICRNGVMRDRIKTNDMRFESDVQAGDTIVLQLQHALPQQIAEPRHLCAILLINDADTKEIINAIKCPLVYLGQKPVNDIQTLHLDWQDGLTEYYDITGKRLDFNKDVECQYKGIIIVKEKKNGTVKTSKLYQ